MFYCLEYSRICVHVCSCVCMHVPMRAHVHTCTYVYVHTCTPTPTCTACEDLWAHACAHMPACACIHAWCVHTCTHVPTHRAHVCLCAYVHTCTHTATCEHLWNRVRGSMSFACVWLCPCVMCVQAPVCICPVGLCPGAHTRAHRWGMFCRFQPEQGCPDRACGRGLRPRSPSVLSTCSWASS